MKFSTIACLTLLLSGAGAAQDETRYLKKTTKNTKPSRGGGGGIATAKPTSSPIELPVVPVKKGLCAIGCVPYVNPADPASGILKYAALVDEMAQKCEIIVHVGDTKAGAAPCNKDLMTGPLKTLAAAAAKYGTMALYSVGDNELNDCHRDGSKVPPKATDFYKAADARAFLISDMSLNNGKDLTGAFDVAQHTLAGTIPGTSSPYTCDFDKYVETDTYAVATLEVMGSFWYLADQTARTYVNQNTVDPLEGRLSMYLNAKDCAIDWITQSAAKASAKGLKAVFLTMQAAFHGPDIEGALVGPYLGVNGVGQYYNATNLAKITKDLTGTAISEPFQPLYDHLTKTAFAYPDIMFYVIHADNHFLQEIRMNSVTNNNGTNIFSHHNLMVLQVEGDSRALSMYSKIDVYPTDFQPVDVRQVWSRAAYDQVPVGHNYYRYS
jgi:hypothetical protein